MGFSARFTCMKSITLLEDRTSAIDRNFMKLKHEKSILKGKEITKII